MQLEPNKIWNSTLRRFEIIFGVVVYCALLSACGKYQSQVSSVSSIGGLQCSSVAGVKTIYGEDNRREWWQVEGALKDHWARATVALVEKQNIKRQHDGFRLTGAPHGRAQLMLRDAFC